eukprot:159991-Pyramimonas_sp.AAC.1
MMSEVQWRDFPRRARHCGPWEEVSRLLDLRATRAQDELQKFIPRPPPEGCEAGHFVVRADPATGA